MDTATKAFILELMAGHNVMTLATVRPDGWPQATTVSYANDGLDLYVACDPDSQKAANIRACPKVSATIDHDCADWGQIRGLSLGGMAEVLRDPADIAYAQELLAAKFPQWAEMPEPDDPAGIAFLRIRPHVISVLDYTQGFGHTELFDLRLEERLAA